MQLMSLGRYITSPYILLTGTQLLSGGGNPSIITSLPGTYQVKDFLLTMGDLDEFAKFKNEVKSSWLRYSSKVLTQNIRLLESCRKVVALTTTYRVVKILKVKMSVSTTSTFDKHENTKLFW